MDLVECLGVGGRLGVAPPKGWDASVELIGLGVSMTLLPLSTGCWFGHTHHWCNRQH